MVRKNYIPKVKSLENIPLPLSLPQSFERIYYYLYTNSNIPRAERLGAEMIRILFCKIYDELYNTENPQFKLLSLLGDFECAQRLRMLFEDVKENFSDVFEENEKLHLDDKSIAYVVKQLADYELIKTTNRDIISEAFQSFWGPGLRGEKGQFFTPRNVIRLCVKILDPQPNETIIDPACGSGGFLAESESYIAAKGKKEELSLKTFNNIFGIDKEIDLVKICKAYMSILGYSYSKIFCADSLDPQSWSKEMQEKIKDNAFDLVFTNPPYGSRISVEDRRILRRYKLAHRYRKSSENKWVITDNILKKQAPQVLFIERCLQLLKPGGRMAIILPDGIFGNPQQRYIIQYVLQEAKILAIVSLPPETFLPSTHTKTSILFLQKKANDENVQDYEIFMAMAYKVGHDKDGKTIYKMNTAGEYIRDEKGNKIVDDDLPEIAEKYKLFKEGKLCLHNHLGFVIKLSQIKDFILIPSYYDPETRQKLTEMQKSGKYICLSIGELVKNGVLSIKRGHEVGSRYYGLGDIPFVRTSDIANWEIKIDPVKCIPKEIYEKYKKRQDVLENDILLVSDGTFLIGRTAIVTSLDKEFIIQSHIKRIRCLKPKELHPYLLLYLLNTDIVQKQIEEKTFVQATISTLGNRIYEVILPIPKEKSIIDKIISEVSEIIKMKVEAKRKIEDLLKIC